MNGWVRTKSLSLQICNPSVPQTALRIRERRGHDDHETLLTAVTFGRMDPEA